VAFLASVPLTAAACYDGADEAPTIVKRRADIPPDQAVVPAHTPGPGAALPEQRPPGLPSAAGPDWIALAAVIVTAALHLTLQARGPNLAIMVGTGVFWAALVAVRALRCKDAFRQWGFRADNLVQAAVVPALVLAVTAAAMALYAHLHGTLRFPPHAALLLLLYPVWGLIQQFLALGIVVNNLELVPVLRGHRVGIVFIGAALFGILHGPDPGLVGGSFVLEVVCIPLYFRCRNLWPLAVLHGWVGALFYLWVLDRDLWVENFG